MWIWNTKVAQGTYKKKYSSVEGVESVKIDLENDTDVIESQSEINKDTLDTALAKTNYTVAY